MFWLGYPVPRPRRSTRNCSGWKKVLPGRSLFTDYWRKQVPHRAQVSEFAEDQEDQKDGLLHPQAGVFFQTLVLGPGGPDAEEFTVGSEPLQQSRPPLLQRLKVSASFCRESHACTTARNRIEAEGPESNPNGKKRLTEKAFPITITQAHLRRVEVLAMIRALYLKILSCMMVVICPAALLAADQPAAMLYSHGTALLNGNSITRSSAIFSGDLVQTQADSVANINATGSAVLVLNDSLVQYQGNAVKLEHGGVTISTSKLLATRAGDVTVSPAASVWTDFEVRDVDGTVQIAARKGDLTISDDHGTTTLAQGQQTTRDDAQSQNSQNEDKKKKKKRGSAGAVTAAKGAILDNPVVIGIGAGAIAGVTAWVLIQGDEPASPSK